MGTISPLCFWAHIAAVVHLYGHDGIKMLLHSYNSSPIVCWSCLSPIVPTLTCSTAVNPVATRTRKTRRRSDNSTAHHAIEQASAYAANRCLCGTAALHPPCGSPRLHANRRAGFGYLGENWRTGPLLGRALHCLCIQLHPLQIMVFVSWGDVGEEVT